MSTLQRHNHARALDMVARHRRGESYRQIGRAHGVTRQRAHQLVQAVLDAGPAAEARLRGAVEARMAKAARAEALLVAARDALLRDYAWRQYRAALLGPLLAEIPADGAPWPSAARAGWLARARAAIMALYPDEEG